ncbi:hypothetical protein [Clostridium culturomicium]|uniref:hypothetical protein n=1 Tax=Clostridium culturomicium TaxID=1499683 RepID=UPI00058D16FC|nr:hypothetical protein [Clostridium culturomicium]
MKLSNSKILNSTGALSKISQMELPIKVSYAVAKNIDKIESELKVYNAEKQKLIDKYTVKDEHGNLKISEEHQEAWTRDIEALVEIEVDIDIHKFSVEEFINSNCNISPGELMAIDYMIED